MCPETDAPSFCAIMVYELPATAEEVQPNPILFVELLDGGLDAFRNCMQRDGAGDAGVRK